MEGKGKGKVGKGKGSLLYFAFFSILTLYLFLTDLSSQRTTIKKVTKN